MYPLLLLVSSLLVSGFGGKPTLAAPVAVWGGGIPLVRSAMVNIQSLMGIAKRPGVLWIQDRYLSTSNGQRRYPGIFGLSKGFASGSSAGSSTATATVANPPSVKYVAGRGLFSSPELLPMEDMLLVSNLTEFAGVPAGKIAFYDVVNITEIQEQITTTLNRTPLIILSGAITEEDSDKIAEFIGTTAALRKLDPIDPDDKLNLKPQDLPALLYMGLFLCIILLGLGMLHGIDAPVAFEDKVLSINREY